MRERFKKYGIASQRKILQFEAENLLKNKKVVVNSSNINCLFLHNSRESLKHWVVKAILFKILRNKKRKVASEVEVKNGIVDLIDLDNLIVYEIERKLNKKIVKRKLKNYGFAKDIFFIDLQKISNDIFEIEKFLKKFVV